KQGKYVCTTRAMDRAARSGHLEMIHWLHANRSEGCTVYAMDIAASRGDLRMLEWLHAHRTEGCSVRGIQYAVWNKNTEVVDWLVRNRNEIAGVDVAALAKNPRPFCGHGMEFAYPDDIQRLNWLFGLFR
ncbi:unnamed protein product, partial [Aphanomyces euteiches]